MKEIVMGRQPYKAEKRRKEIARQKKQEEKRLKRLEKKRIKEEGQNPETGDALDAQPSSDSEALQEDSGGEQDNPLDSGPQGSGNL
jgi:hypothetical protein